MEKTKLGEAHIHKLIYRGDGAKPHWGAKPPLGPKAPHRGWAEGPITVPRQLGLGSEGPQPKLPPLGRRLESWFGLG